MLHSDIWTATVQIRTYFTHFLAIFQGLLPVSPKFTTDNAVFSWFSDKILCLPASADPGEQISDVLIKDFRLQKILQEMKAFIDFKKTVPDFC